MAFEEFEEIRRQFRTKSFWKFAETNLQLVEILYFMITVTQIQDKGRTRAQMALDQMQEILENQGEVDEKKYEEKVKALEDDPLVLGPASKKFFSFYQDLANTLFVRCVDNFKCYISSLLAEVFKANPNMLKSNEKIEVQEVMKYERISDFIEFYINRKINELSYKSIRDLNSYFESKYNFSMFDEVNVDRLSELFHMRNLLVHNWGMVNPLKSKENLIEKYVHDGNIFVGNGFVEIAGFLLTCAEGSDKTVLAKYELSSEKYDPSKKPHSQKWADGLEKKYQKRRAKAERS